MSNKTLRMTYVMAILMAALMAVGSFLGFPGDRVLGGFYWTFVTVFMVGMAFWEG